MIHHREGMGASALAVLILSACQAEQPAPPAPTRLPERICLESHKALDGLSNTGGFEFTPAGQATIEEAAWLPMAPQQRDAIAQALAFHAACEAAEPPREQSVTIKNEGGRVLTQRVVETTIDISKALQE